MGSGVELLEGKDATQSRVCVQSEYEHCRKCLHLEDSLKTARNRCAALELEIEGKKNEVNLLQHKVIALEGEKIAVENELQFLKRKNKELETQGTHTENVTNNVLGEGLKTMGGVIDLTEEIEGEDEVLRLLTENKVLECEKRKAETDVEVWEGKCKEMQSLIMELEKKLVSKDGNTGMQTSGTESKHENGEKDADHIKKRLRFVEEGQPSKKIAPSTPSGMKSTVNRVIDLDDSDENTNELCTPSLSGNNVVGGLTDYGIVNSMGENKEDDYDDLIGPNISFPRTSTPKRKRASNIVASDSDSDDDNLPLCSLRITRSEEQERNNYPKKGSMKSTDSEDEVKDSGKRQRRLVKLKNCEEKGDDDDVREDESDNEGESLDDFIVKDDDHGDGVSDSYDGSNGNDDSAADDSSFDPEIASDNDETFGEIISRIRRKKTHKKLEWQYEAEMLADFADDPELCMKAVCALYRMQTVDEKDCKSTMHQNGRGFSQCDAYRGSELGEFLTDGNPKGDVSKSVKELEEHDPQGLEKCRSLAERYSKQLFEIYKNKEDPLFLPSS